MQKIIWKCLCRICQRPIYHGKPTLLFATEKPMTVGICHSTCGSGRYSYGQFQMCPPDYISDKQISFLVQFYYRLYSLPGGPDPNRELRLYFITLLRNYPASLANPMASLKEFLDKHKHGRDEWLHDGDLETDFLQLLGQIQRAAVERPVGVEIDFWA